MSTRAAGRIGPRWLGSALGILLLAAGCEKPPGEILVLTDRTESNVAPLFAAYTKATGVRIKAVYLDEGLVARLESRPTEADVVITKDAELLEVARTKGLLQPYASSRIDRSVPAEHRDPHGTYFSDSYRARAIFYSKARVQPSDLSGYDSLADPRWRGRVCVRSGYHDYNVSLITQMLANRGAEKTRTFLEGLAANLARRPTGNDRDQAKAIFEDQCDLALMNTYYMGIMLASPDQRPWGEATKVFFPDQDGCGSYILRSGLALTKATRNVTAARSLLEYLVQPNTQGAMTKMTYAYPVNGRGPLPDIDRHFGEGQPQVHDGAFKICKVGLDDMVRQRDKAIALLDAVRFDQHP